VRWRESWNKRGTRRGKGSVEEMKEKERNAEDDRGWRVGG
jgi:hypothetical protein